MATYDQHIITNGQRNGMLSVVQQLPQKKGQRRRIIVRCDCGTEKAIGRDAFLRGTTKSCGCSTREFQRQGRTKHGGCGTPEYGIYKAARQRCNNPNDDYYSDYGGRGIEFRFDSFPDFLAELGPRPSRQHSIDRIETNGHYEKGNVRWATPTDQANNRRPRRWKARPATQ